MPLYMHDTTLPGMFVGFEITKVHFRATTPFQEVVIADTAAYGKALFMDGILMSAALDEGAYHSALVHPAMFSHRCPRRVLIGGGGEGATLREVLRHPEVEAVTMVDIDEAAVDACRTHLPEWHDGAFDDPRVEVLYEDVRAVLARPASSKYDVVILDLGDPASSLDSQLAATREFYELSAAALADGGVVGLQAGEYDGPATDRFRSFVTTLRHTYRTVRPYRTGIRSFCSVWGFALCAQWELPSYPKDLERRLELAHGSTWPHYDVEGHRALMWLSPHERKQLSEGTRVLTDDAPVHLTQGSSAPD